MRESRALRRTRATTRAGSFVVAVAGLGALVALAACVDNESGAGRGATRSYALGRPAGAEQIAAMDIDVSPDGTGLPAGAGSAAQGATIFAAKCASCHGPKGEGMAPAYPPLVGRDSATEQFTFARDPKAPKTIGNYWPYASTLFDYVRRAMPHATPGSLTNDEVYALTAWLLAANGVIATDATLDATSLPRVKMPASRRFVPDNRRGGREVK